jgi:hypothetical protein
MRKLIILIAVGVAVYYFGMPLVKGKWAEAESDNYAENAKARVTGILEGRKKGGAGASTEVQIAICLWATGKPKGCELYKSSDLFDVWCREKGFEGGMASYSIEDVQVTTKDKPRSAVVRCRIDGKPVKMVVPENEPIRWAS